MRALKGEHSVPSPVDRDRPGSKHHLITDAHQFPLAVTLTGGHRHDVTQLIPLVEAIPPARGRNGAELRERRRPRPAGARLAPWWSRPPTAAGSPAISSPADHA
jgi:DDE family transposase